MLLSFQFFIALWFVGIISRFAHWIENGKYELWLCWFEKLSTKAIFPFTLDSRDLSPSCDPVFGEPHCSSWVLTVIISGQLNCFCRSTFNNYHGIFFRYLSCMNVSSMKKNWRNNKWAKNSSAVWKGTRIVKYHQKFRSSLQMPHWNNELTCRCSILWRSSTPFGNLSLGPRLDCHREPEAGGGGVREAAARATRTAASCCGRPRTTTARRQLLLASASPAWVSAAASGRNPRSLMQSPLC